MLPDPRNLPLSLTEAFLDRVVLAAGGERLDKDNPLPNPPKTADYRVGEFVLELKDLQGEGLEVRTRQEKLAQLFASKLRPDRSAIVDPSTLSEPERRTYIDILGGPIRQRLEQAGTQVRATLDRLGAPSLRGGAILLNTGYGSVSVDLRFEIASGAHLLVQTRTRVLNGELDATFRRWYPQFRPETPLELKAAA